MRTVKAFIVCCVLALAAVSPAEAQFGGLGKKIKQKAQQRIEQKENDAAEKAVDAADPTTKKAGAAASDASGEAASADAAGAAEASAAAEKLAPGKGAWANYDFVPGDRVLYADDFMADRVGNFPKGLEFQSGNMEIVEWNGGRWLRAEEGEFVINLGETLPERFTMEFDLAGNGNAMWITFHGGETYGEHYLEVGTWFARLRSGKIDAQGSLGAKTEEAPVKIRIQVDGGYLKLYANEKRAINVPNAKMGRSNQIRVNMNGWSAELPRMIANIRVAAGGKELYDALSANGRVATQGIYFDTGSDRIRGESTPTLKEIGTMLQEHPELKLTIEGHTDNVGGAAANKSLSEKRAAAVRAFLVSAYGIEESRLSSKGMGDTKPAAPNTTPAGRQQNRRVELVKM